MSRADDNRSANGFDSIDQELCYVYSPQITDASERPCKRQKVEDPFHSPNATKAIDTFEFKPLLNGYESLDCQEFRKRLFAKHWAATETRIKETLDAANGKTVENIINFLHASVHLKGGNQIPTGFVSTGPNFASQELIFKQVFNRLKSDTNNPVVTIRSTDAINLKSVLKLLIRDAVTLIRDEHSDEASSEYYDDQRLLNYDLKILQNFVVKHMTKLVTIVIQDSEAFDTTLLAELIILFSSWRDRIPFQLIIGIGTSIELFYDRICRAASLCLSGELFEVEQSSSLIERIFLQAVAGAKAPLNLGSNIISALMERLEDHILSVQDFVLTLKYAYMCHYYFDAMSIFNVTNDFSYLSKIIQREHLEAIRMLPSFRESIEREISHGNSKEHLLRARSLLTDDNLLLNEIERLTNTKRTSVIRLLQAIHILANASSESLSKIDVYLTAAKGFLGDSKFVQDIHNSVKKMTAKDSIAFIDRIRESIHNGAPEMDLAGWDENENEFLSELTHIRSQVSMLEDSCLKNGSHLKSRYEIHQKCVRTEVVAQKVQLNYQDSLLSSEDKEFTAHIDRLSQLLGGYFSVASPQRDFLREVWTFDSLHHIREVFTMRPRAALERALSSPSDYLTSCSNISIDKQPARQPATATLYQMYLESGSLINIFDLWSAFSHSLKAADQVAYNERDALVLFYRALANLKMIGMVKHSRTKIEHLSKLAWKGL